jgi:hypothetical protein
MFNHAIVSNRYDGKIFWIDQQFCQHGRWYFPGYSERPVLVFSTKEPSYETTPPINDQHSKMVIKATMEVTDRDILKTEGELKLIGETAQEFTGAALSHSLQLIEEAVIQILSGEASPLKKKVTLPPLDSRIVKDLVVTYAYDQENNLLLTNTGSGFCLTLLG